MAGGHDRQPQPLGVQRVVVVGLAGQQAVGLHGQRLFKQAAASPADDSQPPHGLARVRIFDRHFRAVQRRVAPGTQLHLCFAGQLRDGDGFHLAHPAAAAGERLPVFHFKDACQHFIDTALGGIQVGVHTDGGDPFLHQLERQVGRAQFFQRVEDDRVVGDDELAAVLFGLRQRFGRDIQCHQHPGDFPAAVHQQAGVIPAFGQLQRSHPLHLFIDLLDGCHSSILP